MNSDDSPHDVVNVNRISYVQNYKQFIEIGSVELFSKYIDVISKYLEYFRNSVNVRKNLDHYKYILIKGQATLCHVFKILVLYTKNIDLVLHHCEKSFFYYIEFITQIDKDHHTLLKLNSTDATYFVFKKTIYEINDEYRKKFTQLDEDNTTSSSDNAKLTRMNKMIDIYNRLFVNIVHSTILDDAGGSNDLAVNGQQVSALKIKMKKLSDIFLNYLQSENENEEDVMFGLLNVTESFVCNYKNNANCIVPYMDILFKKIKKKLGNKNKNLTGSSEILDQISKNIKRVLSLNHADETVCMNPSKYMSLLIKY